MMPTHSFADALVVSVMNPLCLVNVDIFNEEERKKDELEKAKESTFGSALKLQLVELAEEYRTNATQVAHTLPMIDSC